MLHHSLDEKNQVRSSLREVEVVVIVVLYLIYILEREAERFSPRVNISTYRKDAHNSLFVEEKGEGCECVVRARVEEKGGWCECHNNCSAFQT